MRLNRQANGSNPTPPKLLFNVIYFGFLFIVLALMHSYSVLLASKFSASPPWIFVFHAIVQAGLEAGILAYIAAIFQNRRWKKAQIFFISFTVVIIIIHIIDFHLVRIMDVSFWYAMDFILDESWRNFLELLIASTVPFSKILLSIVLFCLTLILALYFFRRSQMFVQKKNLSQRMNMFASKKRKALLLASVFCIGLWEYSSIGKIEIEEYDRLSRALPLKRIFFSPSPQMKISCQLKPHLQENEFKKSVASESLELKKKPNIYIFVIETLREDFLTQEIAPNLHAFKESNISFRETRSSSNTTPISWFSLFFSQSPLHFGEISRSVWESGCPTVQILKEAGYKVHLYSGSRLSYYGLDQILFGKNYDLIDDNFIALPSRDHPAWQCDRATLSKLCADIRSFKEEEGHLFITFIESTHFGYSWPNDLEKKFTPYCSEINFFKAACLQENIAEIQNRYRNSINYVDGLMGDVLATIEQAGRMSDSIIVVTADHGEEFFEEGSLFHASALSQQQIRVPLYCHFANGTSNTLDVQAEMASHEDVLPSLLHYLYGREVCSDVLHGESVFREKRWPFLVTGRYNGCRSPHEFLVQSENGKILHARFGNPSNPAQSRFVEILDCKDPSSKFLEMTPEQMEEEFGGAFGKLFQR